MVVRSGVCRTSVGKPKGKRPTGRSGVDRMIVLTWIFRKLDVGARTSDSIKLRELLTS
jgi:hypothetical protein